MKQEEIREGIDYCIRYADYDDFDEIKIEALAAKILGYLHSHDVVIKVERKPNVDEEMFGLVTKEIMERVPDLYLADKSAYYVLEPLIGE